MRKDEERGRSIFRGRWGRLCMFILIFLLSAAVARGAEFPTKTVQLVNPYPPGGTTDIVSRLLTEKLSSLLGQPVVVVNKTGGGGAIGIQSVKDGAADGYTILVAPPPIALIPIVSKVAFSLKDFTAINLAVSSPSMILVKSDAPWRTLEDLIAEAKKSPGKLSYSSGGPRTTPHFAGELFKMLTGTDLTHVPMNGEVQAATSVLGGHTNVSFLSLGSTQSHIEAGTLRALAVAYRKRLRTFPNIPTTVERGYEKLNISVWIGYFVPAKTPRGVINKLAEVFDQALQDKQIITKIENAKVTVENLGIDEAAKFLAEEHEKWSEVARVAKIGN